MAPFNAKANYRENQCNTASKGQLLLMAYDGMLRFLSEGRRAMHEQRYEEQNTCLTKTQALLLELTAALDHGANPEIASRLEALYLYMYDELTKANVYDDEKGVTEVARLLANLREAWVEAERQTRCQEGAAQAIGAGGFAA